MRKTSVIMTLWFYLVMILPLPINMAAAAEVAGCQLSKSVCVDGPSTKTISGNSVTRDCWEYKNEYTCLDPNAADYCAPLKVTDAKCGVTGQTCLEKSSDGICMRYTNQYSCELDQKALHNGTLPENITELPPTHQITSDWDTSKCDALTSNKKCKVVATKCTEGPETRVINGVAVTKDCWKEERTLQCSTGNDQNECSQYQNNSACQVKSDKCVSTLPDGTCQIREKTFSCTESGATTKEVSSCEDQDFAKTMTTMEMSREMQKYYNNKDQRFFGGTGDKCSIKLGGALDGVLGGNCCKTDSDPSSLVDFAVNTGTQMAASYLLKSVASHYTYTTLLQTEVSQTIGTAINAAGGLMSGAGGGGVGAYGVTVSSTSTGTLTVAFNPATFAVAIAMMALQQWLACGQEETLVAMKRKADLCHYVGSYCGTKSLGACVKKVESQCCYISKLAKIVNVGGREQLHKGFGTPEAPQCEGFTSDELQQLDFSKLDMSEFYNEIYANMSNVATQSNSATAQGKSTIESGKNTTPTATRSYYEQ